MNSFLSFVTKLSNFFITQQIIAIIHHQLVQCLRTAKTIEHVSQFFITVLNNFVHLYISFMGISLNVKNNLIDIYHYTLAISLQGQWPQFLEYFPIAFFNSIIHKTMNLFKGFVKSVSYFRVF